MRGHAIPCTTYNLVHPHAAYLDLQGRQKGGGGGGGGRWAGGQPPQVEGYYSL